MISDEELYDQLVAGKMAAFDELYVRYERRLFGFILVQLGNRAEAEDVFHDAFMAMLREPRHKEMRNFRAWIFQVARHLCLNRLRSDKRAARALSLQPGDASSPPHPEIIAAAKEVPQVLQRAVATLPTPLAQVYELRASGHSYDEMARILGVPLGTVKSRMSEMVTRLKEETSPWTAK
jgi:RNA polymerase sigma-70 factor, ECF subfamily